MGDTHYKGLISIISPIVMILAFGESLLSLVQLIITKGNNFNGTFINSGPFACFLAVSLPFSFIIVQRSKKQFIKIISILTIVFSAVLISYSLSRTAIIALILSMAILFWDNIKKLLNQNHKTSYLYCIILFVIISVFLVLIINIKYDSILGRLMIWKISLKSISSIPLAGIGWDHVSAFYAEAQESFFENNPNSIDELRIAETPNFLFNEFINITIAFGIPGLLILCTLLFMGLYYSIRNKNLTTLSSLSALIIVMFSSYPLHCIEYPTLISLIIIASTSGCDIKYKIVPILSVVTVSIYLSNLQFSDITGKMYYTAIKLNKEGNFKESNEIISKYLLNRVGDTSVLNLKGINFQKIGIKDSAVYYFRKSLRRVPIRHYPNYLLLKLYLENGDTIKALHEAKTIILKKPKVLSPAIEDMRLHASSLIHSVKQDIPI